VADTHASPRSSQTRFDSWRGHSFENLPAARSPGHSPRRGVLSKSVERPQRPPPPPPADVIDAPGPSRRAGGVALRLARAECPRRCGRGTMTASRDCPAAAAHAPSSRPSHR
jgi:hypothetical protein